MKKMLEPEAGVASQGHGVWRALCAVGLPLYAFCILSACQKTCPVGSSPEGGVCVVYQTAGTQAVATSGASGAADAAGAKAESSSSVRTATSNEMSGAAAMGGNGSAGRSPGVAPASTMTSASASPAGSGGMSAAAGSEPSGSGGSAGSMPMTSAVAGSSAGSGGEPASKCPLGQMEEPEKCDAVDIDSDGMVDERLMEECGSSSVEPCRKGMKTCSAGAWSECKGAVEPEKEVCDAERTDENCDGAVNEGCECTEGQAVPCGRNVGVCKQGMQQCVGGQLTRCTDAVTPQPREICDGSLDEDCDGRTDEGCECKNGAQEPCMVRDACGPGMHACRDGRWGQCTGAVVCARDKVCSNARCVDCMEGATRPCGEELPMPCKRGMQTCRGGMWDPQCVGAKGPTEDVCNGVDDDCDGSIDNGCPNGQSCVKLDGKQLCSQQLPPGPYQDGCEGCSYDGTTLSCARCAGDRTGARPSSLRVNDCAPGQRIANCNSTLSCRDSEGTVLSGPFSQNCRRCTYDLCTLRCEACEDMSGDEAPAMTADFPCTGGVTNCDGRLVCGRCAP